MEFTINKKEAFDTPEELIKGVADANREQANLVLAECGRDPFPVSGDYGLDGDVFHPVHQMSAITELATNLGIKISDAVRYSVNNHGEELIYNLGEDFSESYKKSLVSAILGVQYFVKDAVSQFYSNKVGRVMEENYGHLEDIEDRIEAKKEEVIEDVYDNLYIASPNGQADYLVLRWGADYGTGREDMSYAPLELSADLDKVIDYEVFADKETDVAYLPNEIVSLSLFGEKIETNESDPDDLISKKLYDGLRDFIHTSFLPSEEDDDNYSLTMTLSDTAPLFTESRPSYVEKISLVAPLVYENSVEDVASNTLRANQYQADMVLAGMVGFSDTEGYAVKVEGLDLYNNTLDCDFQLKDIAEKFLNENGITFADLIRTGSIFHDKEILYPREAIMGYLEERRAQPSSENCPLCSDNTVTMSAILTAYTEYVRDSIISFVDEKTMINDEKLESDHIVYDHLFLRHLHGYDTTLKLSLPSRSFTLNEMVNRKKPMVEFVPRENFVSSLHLEDFSVYGVVTLNGEDKTEFDLASIGESISIDDLVEGYDDLERKANEVLYSAYRNFLVESDDFRVSFAPSTGYKPDPIVLAHPDAKEALKENAHSREQNKTNTKKDTPDTPSPK